VTNLLRQPWQTRRDTFWNNTDELAKLLKEIEEYLSGVSLFYPMRDEIRARVAELKGEPVLPQDRRRWSQRQWDVANCPNCGRDYNKKEGAAA
jgi:hypothetical protein